jgi:cobalt-precorrin-5B (C1)-methyltransferase
MVSSTWREEERCSMARDYREALGDVAGMRRGLSSGSCACAAAKAALLSILQEQPLSVVDITLPRGKEPYSGLTVSVPVEGASPTPFTVADEESGVDNPAGGPGKTRPEWSGEARVRKDAGDDTDITNGAIIGARVRLTDRSGEIVIDGGEGVGRISSGGTPGRVGEAAINPVPRRMIRENLLPHLPRGRGVEVELFVPRGRELAESTWNPRIGIEEGISIIGTKGVVEPKSEEAYKVSIKSVIVNFRKRGVRRWIITPGYVGERYLTALNIPMDRVLTVGDHMGYAIEEVVKAGADSILLVGHIGKLTKLGAGIFNTHWKSGDARLEVIAAYAAADGADPGTVRRILDLKLAEEAVPILKEQGLLSCCDAICRRINERVTLLTGGLAKEPISLGSVMLDLSGKPVGSWPKGLSPKEGP